LIRAKSELRRAVNKGKKLEMKREDKSLEKKCKQSSKARKKIESNSIVMAQNQKNQKNRS